MCPGNRFNTDDNVLDISGLILQIIKHTPAISPATISTASTGTDLTSPAKELVIGIDLGTTYSLAAMVVTDNDNVTVTTTHVFHTPDGLYLLPSAVYFEDGQPAFGPDPISIGREHAPKQVIDEVKRLIGHQYTSPVVQTMKKQKSYAITEGPNSTVQIEVPQTNGTTKKYFPETVSSLILGHIVQYVQQQTSMAIESAVITVPAYFNNAQRQATKLAAEAAGIKVARLLNEPSAAAFAFQKTQKLIHGEESYRALIFDFGGGTCDVAVLEVEAKEITVLAVSGDTHLGGADIDEILVDWAIREYRGKYRMSITESRTKIRQKMECAKKRLCNQYGRDEKCCLVGSDNKERPLVLSHIMFNDLIKDIVTKCEDLVNKALKQVYSDTSSTFLKDSLRYFVPVGGSSRIPLVIETLEKRLGVKANKCAHPDQAVAEGAAIFADSLRRGNAAKIRNKLQDVTAFSLGTECLFPGDRIGTPARLSVIIPANSRIPVCELGLFTTVRDNQTALSNCIYEGENPVAEENQLLGRFIVNDLPPQPKGEVTMAVTFSIDCNGIFNAIATILDTYREIHYHVNDFYATAFKEIEAASAGYLAKHALVAEQQKARGELEAYLAAVQKLLDDNQASLCADINSDQICGRIKIEQNWIPDNLKADASIIERKRKNLEAEFEIKIAKLEQWIKARKKLKESIDSLETEEKLIDGDLTLTRLMTEAGRAQFHKCELTKLLSMTSELERSFRSAKERRLKAKQSLKDVLERNFQRIYLKSAQRKKLSEIQEWLEKNGDEGADAYEAKLDELENFVPKDSIKLIGDKCEAKKNMR
eukprot:Gregarina_sp_Poly_1__2792@NODE_1777_length_3354_cov_127_735929_g1157_i0_p1_GENE_NODE_1777_length_3354_cov_127_735929_g1157_i0NODE_1777_length_3354_cov_127_735929_g1157_i0_p1_ORF_typecomplete_len819_score127_67HSP70/PF00012_20/1_1e70MreB_Mbl/PF06723_13/5_5e03MreB_Mbl/PF06723_13/2_6e03MreB_Mbl/PF06723_13/1_6e23StbA/PF06406_11/1_2e05StbA/PF06406_11/2_4e03Actin/PF00022_19/0_00034Hydantoinase_A/PF01968_18/0_83Hydantoinase_A/PF01968_18/1_7e03Hydantoinase_A/PF01968_18/3_3DDR/PF08841_10/0_018DUF2795/PF1